jgi:hypothetical protein
MSNVREIAVDRSQWRVVFGSKGPRATKETPGSSRPEA